MTDQIQIKLMKAIINADLTKSEIKMIIHLSTKKDKYFIIDNMKITTEMGFEAKKMPNVVRTITDLKKKNVIKIREFGKEKIKKAYITLSKDWQSIEKK